MKNPVDDFMTAKQERATARKVNDVQLWERWKQAPAHEKPKHLEPLLKAYEPSFLQKRSLWRPPKMPASAFDAALKGHFVNALESYNPERAALSTHVEMRMQKVLRDVVKNQNLAYIPEGQVRHIGKIQKAKDILTEEYGRAPTASEIADHLGMSPKKVETIMSSVKKDIPSSTWETDPTKQQLGRQTEVIDMMKIQPNAYFPKPIHQDVFEHIYGLNGKKQMDSTNALAKQLGTSPSVISRAKSHVVMTVKSFL